MDGRSKIFIYLKYIRMQNVFFNAKPYTKLETDETQRHP